jgi:chromate reductase
MKVLGIAGSLRSSSYNRGLLRAAVQVAPDGITVEPFDLTGIPIFNQDEEDPVPARVGELKSAIREADAILLATPEYNYSVPGVLKNAIDWASRPYGDSAWDDKPVAIMGASVGALGTGRAQYHLRQMCVFLNMHALNSPEVMVPHAAKNFDDRGNLANEQSRELGVKLLASLAEWTDRLRR